ncbi:ABC transporter permease subunit [Candidatus Lokiarchaeum ossiferum]|uniref:ABC transporter permease subunit n=1 Tax=Candidatus Lokiarchaeum ossiferum TaxID=2951803 RepID=UPI00352FC223
MSLLTITKIEIKKSLKATLLLSIIMGLFVLMIAVIFDPDLFAEVEDIFSNYPEAILDMVGGVLDMSTFAGFYTVEFLAMIWMWLGIYFVLKAGQDIPSTIENKTIDLILSKPVKRWEFILGRYLRFLFTILTVIISMGLITVLLILILPNLKDQEINAAEFITALTWAFLLILSLTTTAFFFSTFLNRKNATGAAFGIFVVFFVIGTFYTSFQENIQDIKFLSIFFYYEPARIMVSHSYENVLRDMLILFGYTLVLTISSIMIFDRRDIPV